MLLPRLPESVRERMAGSILGQDHLQQQLKRPHTGDGPPPGCFGRFLSVPLTLAMLLLAALRCGACFNLKIFQK